MRPVTVQVGGAGASSPIPCDVRISPFQLSLTVLDLAGSVDMTVEYTNDDIWAEGYNPAAGNWLAHTALTNVLELTVGTIISPVTAVRLVNADTGTAQLRVVQAGGP